MKSEPERKPPTASSSLLMARFRSKDTAPELRLRKTLHGRGLRYRIHFPVPGLPRRSIDIAFPSRRVAVFVDGCYWHGCPEHAKRPAVNTEWWDWKIGGNVQRDLQTIEALEEAGWTVLRIWEHVPTEEAASKVIALVRDEP